MLPTVVESIGVTKRTEALGLMNTLARPCSEAFEYWARKRAACDVTKLHN